MTDCAQGGDGLPSPVVGWIRNYAIKNYWRVAGFYELDDLFQDGLLCAVKCRHRYGRVTDPHLMSLTQTAFTRYLIDLTRRYELVGDSIYIADLGPDEVAVRERYGLVEHPLGELARCIEELPDHLYRLLRGLVTDKRFHVSRRSESDLRSFFLCDC